jgi:mitogen-activated protein kinase kinase kinase
VHRDIKGGNVLITREGVAKLADLGASRVYNDPDMTSNITSAQGSTFWCAPEVIQGQGYGRKADIWSLGCTLIEMFTGKHPWPELAGVYCPAFHIVKIGPTGPPRPPAISPEALDFINCCLRCSVVLSAPPVSPTDVSSITF